MKSEVQLQTTECQSIAERRPLKVSKQPALDVERLGLRGWVFVAKGLKEVYVRKHRADSESRCHSLEEEKNGAGGPP
jgi:hypothetical protein